MTKQDDLLEFVNDPKTIAAAVEGSMDKRRAMTTNMKQNELRNKLRALPRTNHRDERYPIDAYEDDLVDLINSEVLAVLEDLGETFETLETKGQALSAIQTLKERYK